LRCKVFVAGGNLGCTQLGRVEYALSGGRIYTDAIDNSAGVDTSDHEVNIKILLGLPIVAGEMTLKQRDVLLAEMTDDVAALVLRDNIFQTQWLSVGNRIAPQLLDANQRFIHFLENRASSTGSSNSCRPTRCSPSGAPGISPTSPEWRWSPTARSGSTTSCSIRPCGRSVIATALGDISLLRERYAARMLRQLLERDIIDLRTNSMVNVGAPSCTGCSRAPAPSHRKSRAYLLNRTFGFVDLDGNRGARQQGRRRSAVRAAHRHPASDHARDHVVSALAPTRR
jgi:glutamate dehydrogenase